MPITAYNPAPFADLPGHPFDENWLTIDLGEGFSARMHPEELTEGVIAMAQKAGFLA
jgi:hypothetical protein